MNADSISIESDEDGFHLIIEVADEDGREGMPHRLDFNIQDIAEDFYKSVRYEIEPWLREMKDARREHAQLRRAAQVFHCSPDDVDESGGYALSDPKHESFHSVHADIWDAREGK